MPKKEFLDVFSLFDKDLIKKTKSLLSLIDIDKAKALMNCIKVEDDEIVIRIRWKNSDKQSKK